MKSMIRPRSGLPKLHMLCTMTDCLYLPIWSKLYRLGKMLSLFTSLNLSKRALNFLDFRVGQIEISSLDDTQCRSWCETGLVLPCRGNFKRHWMGISKLLKNPARKANLGHLWHILLKENQYRSTKLGSPLQLLKSLLIASSPSATHPCTLPGCLIHTRRSRQCLRKKPPMHSRNSMGDRSRKELSGL